MAVWWSVTRWRSDPSTQQYTRFETIEHDRGPTNADRHPAYEAIIGEADRVADQLVTRYPENPRALFLAGQLHQRIGQSTAAIQLWRQCLQLNPEDIEARLAIGMLLFEAGDFADAEPILTDAFLRSRSPQAAYLLASLLLNQGKLEQAADVLQDSLSVVSDSVPNHILLGQVRLQQKQPAKAKDSFLAATQLAPQQPSAWFGLATASRQLDQPTDAARYRATFQELQQQQLREEIEQTKQHDDLRVMQADLAATYTAIGRLALEQADVASAELHWQLALKLDDSSLEARVNLARLYHSQNHNQQALATLLSIRTDQSEDVQFWLHLGQFYVQLEAFEQADQAFARAAQLEPQMAQAYAARAELYIRFDRSTDEALAMASKAVEREPRAAHYFLLSVAKHRTGDQAGARRAAEQAAALEPKNSQYQQWYLLMHEQR